MRNTKSTTRKPSSRDIAKHFRKSHNTINDMSNSEDELELNEYKAMSLYTYLLKQGVDYEMAMDCQKEVAKLKRDMKLRDSFLEKKVVKQEKEIKILNKQVLANSESELIKENQDLQAENDALINELAK